MHQAPAQHVAVWLKVGFGKEKGLASGRVPYLEIIIHMSEHHSHSHTELEDWRFKNRQWQKWKEMTTLKIHQ